MNYRVTILFAAMTLSALSLLADDKKPAPSKQAAPAQTLTIPKGAVESGPYTWKHTDAAGRKWIYQRTPFGVTRVEDMPEPARAEPPQDRTKSWKVTEDADQVTFENQSPFGPQRWSKKKSELNEIEQSALARTQRDAATKSSKSEGKN